MRHHDDDIDRALAGWRQGDHGAVDELFRLVYDELRILARRHIRRLRPGDTLGPTALVHEVYLRFADRSSPNLLDRDHFVALAASAMRMVIVDDWRRKHSRKRDPQAPISVNVEDVPAPEARPNFDDLRFFGGLTLDEIATMLGVSERTVKREWQKARMFLYHAMRSSGDEDHA